MTTDVFDTEPLIAYLYDEPGASDVTERLAAVQDDDTSAAIAHATATELVYKVARLETDDPNHAAPDEEHLAVGENDLHAFRGFGVTVETPSWRTVAEVKAPGGLSLGDSYAVALAVEQDATLVVGADPEFASVPVDVDLHRIRTDSV